MLVQILIKELHTMKISIPIYADSSKTLAHIALDIPAKPTTRDLMTALVRAEEAGYQRAKRENTCPVCVPKQAKVLSILRRQAE
jgi:hypothetical protein